MEAVINEEVVAKLSDHGETILTVEDVLLTEAVTRIEEDIVEKAVILEADLVTEATIGTRVEVELDLIVNTKEERMIIKAQNLITEQALLDLHTTTSIVSKQAHP